MAKLPLTYENYVFDLYGTLVDIRTDEDDATLWGKLCLFYGYYDAHYTPEELKKAYYTLVKGKETKLKSTLEQDPKYAHEASPEIELTDVFLELFQTKNKQKNPEVNKELAIHTGQFFRALSTDYVKLYEGTKEMLQSLKNAGKKIYLLSNAQRIFTEYEMHVLDIAKYFDAILISSDYKTKKPDKRFFDILVEKYHLDTSKTLFIGNDSRTDIGGAKTVGFDTFYVKSNISPKGDMAKDATYIVKEFDRWERNI
ncbi:MAG: HAD family hydrolase [Lachnospiraceae bacterium]|nr:HAD family hydrolase [Lachnospiraceae bacterium]